MLFCAQSTKTTSSRALVPSSEVLVGKELVGPNNLSCGYKVSNKFRANIPILWENHGKMFEQLKENHGKDGFLV